MFKFSKKRREALKYILVGLCNTKDNLKIENKFIYDKNYLCFPYKEKDIKYYRIIKKEMIEKIYCELFKYTKKDEKNIKKLISEFSNLPKEEKYVLIKFIIKDIFKIFLSNSAGEPIEKQISLSEAIIDKIEKHLNEELIFYFPIEGIDIG